MANRVKYVSETKEHVNTYVTVGVAELYFQMLLSFIENSSLAIHLASLAFWPQGPSFQLLLWSIPQILSETGRDGDDSYHSGPGPLVLGVLMQTAKPAAANLPS